MNIFIAGDVHGEIESFYERIISLENKLNITADWVLQTGNLGVWPDPLRIDRQTRIHNKVDFFKYYLESKAVPRPTVFVAGKHEDHRWLNFIASRNQLEVIPDLTWLLNGYKTHIGNGGQISLVGLGKVYSPKYYKLNNSISHYTKFEVDKACAHGPTDILITHEAGKKMKIGNRVSDAEGINNLCWALRPKIHIHGHTGISKVYTNSITDTPTISLAFKEIRALHFDGKDFSLIN